MALSISYGDIEAAHRRLQGVVHRTPVMRSKTVDDLTGAQVFFKCENFQLFLIPIRPCRRKERDRTGGVQVPLKKK